MSIPVGAGLLAHPDGLLINPIASKPVFVAALIAVQIQLRDRSEGHRGHPIGVSTTGQSTFNATQESGFQDLVTAPASFSCKSEVPLQKPALTDSLTDQGPGSSRTIAVPHRASTEASVTQAAIGILLIPRSSVGDRACPVIVRPATRLPTETVINL